MGQVNMDVDFSVLILFRGVEDVVIFMEIFGYYIRLFF